MHEDILFYGIIGIGFCTILYSPIKNIATLVVRKKQKKKILSLSKSAEEITADEFLNIRKDRSNKKYIAVNDFAGVYILLNTTQGIYYVGQSINVFKRVNSHFTGKGNGDVYADYKYNQEFTIKMIPLKNSGFKSLDDLERNAITAYKAFKKGYNKNRGNK